MDGISSSSVVVGGLSVLLPLAYSGGMSCWQWLWDKPLHKRKKICICVPEGSGKSTACQILRSSSKDCLLVDLDSTLGVYVQEPELLMKLDECKLKSDWGNYNILNRKASKEALQWVKDNWLNEGSEKRVIFFTKELSLANELFKKESIVVCLPSNSLFQKTLKNQKVDKQKSMLEDRNSYIKEPFEPFQLLHL